MRIYTAVLFFTFFITFTNYSYGEPSMMHKGMYKVKDFYFNSGGNLIINQINKTAEAFKNIVIIRDNNRYTANKIKVWFSSLKHLTFDNVLKLEAIKNVKIITSKNQIITGYKYIYDKKLHVHVIEGAPNIPVTYKDKTSKLIAKNRIEYFIDKNVAVIRGNPIVTNKSKNNNVFTISSHLMNIKLENDNIHPNKKHIAFIEALDKVKFKNKDNKITADYAIYYKKENQIEFDGNVKFHSKSGYISGCKAIYNLTSGIGTLLPCSHNKEIEGNITSAKGLKTKK